MPFLPPILLPLGAVLVFATFSYFVALKLRDNSIADAIWGPQQVIIASVALARRTDIWQQVYPWVLAAMIGLWALRLSWFILARRSAKPGEDWRYKEMRQRWGRWAYLHSLFKVFYLQALFAFILGLPVINALFRPSFEWTLFQVAGLLLWGWGLIWEGLADWQLLHFKKSAAKGAIMQQGVWRYCRHPNYIGEIAVWWGIYLFSQSWLMIISPALITLLIARVSGVPMAEKRYEGNREYDAYKRRTPALIPSFLWPRQLGG